VTSPALVALEPRIRDYAWGSTSAVPRLLGIAPTGRPMAELWFGAHPDDPSPCPGVGTDLGALIATDPMTLLGADTAARFGGRLPFLLKVLSAEKPLSIQVHPSLAQARAGYADEQARGVAVDAPDRNYRDANHKPELLCALTEFDALCGLRPAADTLQLLAALDVAALMPLRDALTGPDGLRVAFELLLATPLADRDALIDATLAGCRRLAADGPWGLAAQACRLAADNFPGDIGAVLTLLLNAVRLQPGEAIYLGAGNIHAYLRGTGIEIMANSDNVLRCGLTAKHVDVAEVLRVAVFTALPEPRWPAREVGAHERVFAVPVPDFELAVLDIADQLDTAASGPQILLCTQGAVTVAGPGRELRLSRGRAAFVAAGQQLEITGVGTVYRATTGR
jgi:mannose-6-phosphate isomerase